jgi:Protein of unknown function (DUF3489)
MKTQETTTGTTKMGSKKPKASKAKAPKVTKAAKAAKSPKQATAKGEGRAGSKKEIVLKLLRRDQGATIAEIAKATNWQNHTIRGFSQRAGDEEDEAEDRVKEERRRRADLPDRLVTRAITPETLRPSCFGA